MRIYPEQLSHGEMYRAAKLENAQLAAVFQYAAHLFETCVKILEIPYEDLSIKAKTKEKMDAVGQKLAIEANSAVLLKKIK